MKWLLFVNPFFLLFWALPPILIFSGFTRKSRMSLRSWFLVYVLFGWIFICLGIWLHYHCLGWLNSTPNNPPQGGADTWSTDGAKQVFGLYFGWAYAMVYFACWFVPTWLIRALIRLAKRRESSNQSAEIPT